MRTRSDRRFYAALERVRAEIEHEPPSCSSGSLENTQPVPLRLEWVPFSEMVTLPVPKGTVPFWAIYRDIVGESPPRLNKRRAYAEPAERVTSGTILP